MAKQQFNVKKYKVTVVANTILRLFFGLTIFINPYLSSLATFLLDWADGEFLKKAGYPRSKYNIYDKILDYYWYVSILLYVLYFNVPGKEILIFLFLFRSVGQTLFFLTKKETILFFFPNVFELFFFFYLFVTVFPILIPFMYLPKALYPLIILTVLRLISEYILHIDRMNLSWFFTGKTTYWVDDKPKKVQQKG